MGFFIIAPNHGTTTQGLRQQIVKSTATNYSPLDPKRGVIRHYNALQPIVMSGGPGII